MPPLVPPISVLIPCVSPGITAVSMTQAGAANYFAPDHNEE